MRLSEGIPFKTCINPPARDQNINGANLYENEMVLTYCVKLFRRLSYLPPRQDVGIGKRGLLEKGSFQKSPFSRDSRDSREPPDSGKQRRFRPFSRDSREFRDFRDSRDFSCEKTPFVMTPFSVPEDGSALRFASAKLREDDEIMGIATANLSSIWRALKVVLMSGRSCNHIDSTYSTIEEVVQRCSSLLKLEKDLSAPMLN